MDFNDPEALRTVFRGSSLPDSSLSSSKRSDPTALTQMRQKIRQMEDSGRGEFSQESVLERQKQVHEEPFKEAPLVPKGDRRRLETLRDEPPQEDDEPAEHPLKLKGISSLTAYAEQKAKAAREAFAKQRQEYEEKAPLPPHWKEVDDEKSGKKYYWNTRTGETTWNRGKAVSDTDDPLADSIPPHVQNPAFAYQQTPPHPQHFHPAHPNAFRGRGGVFRGHPRGGFGPRQGRPGPAHHHHERRDQHPYRRPRREQRGEDELDPMDPAAYSETKRGGWGAGLRRDGELAADSTAGGPLYQQRPYPSPGEILRQRAAQDQSPAGPNPQP